jgi:glucose-6-phosphate 1-dehydrogenase
MMVPSTASEPEVAPAARPAPPCTMVIFGAGGDLTKRLLTPALYNLAASGLLPEAFAVIGVARRGMSDDDFRRGLDDDLRAFATRPVAAATARSLLDRFFFVQGDFDDALAYERLRDRLGAIERERGTGGNRLFYLATPPAAFAPIVRRLAAAGLTREEAGAWRRVVVEKPFGTDLASAHALNAELLAALDERQIYRIDHYLGKETVQNIMVMRFANGLFEPIWNREHIDHVQITVAETVSVERRGKFYDATGALRDMVPNHVFQLLALTAMEPPVSFAADAVRTEKSKVMDACRVWATDGAQRAAVRAQYAAGEVQGRAVPSYRAEPGVAPDSATETFAAMRLLIDNWRWAGVPFYLRTGKALAARKTQIAIKFKQAPFSLFRDTPVERFAPNFLVLRIQPDEGIALEFNAKVPGPQLSIDGVRMDMKYKDYFDAAPSTGYETLIYDCMMGDATLFQRADNVEAGWRVVQPILDAWRERPQDGMGTYAAGGEGPDAARELLARDGREWRPLA